MTKRCWTKRRILMGIIWNLYKKCSIKRHHTKPCVILTPVKFLFYLLGDLINLTKHKIYLLIFDKRWTISEKKIASSPLVGGHHTSISADQSGFAVTAGDSQFELSGCYNFLIIFGFDYNLYLRA